MVRQVDITRLSRQLKAISDSARQLESAYSADLDAVHPKFRASARNLVHYLALRQSDISELQEDLTRLGLASLSRAERNVMASLRAVRVALKRIAGDTSPDPDLETASLTLDSPTAVEHKTAILGETPEHRNVSIMVTLPSEAAQNRKLVAEMIAAGMNVARINCAHDSRPVWQAIIENARTASTDAGKDCRIIIELAWPKLRTGALLPGPKVVHLQPRRGP